MPSFFENILAVDQTHIWGTMLASLLADHLLVACRLAGLLLTLPGLNGGSLPWHLKCLLLVVLAAIVAPNVSPAARHVVANSRKVSASTDANDPVQKVAHAERELDSRHLSDVQKSHSRPAFRFSRGLRSVGEFVRLAACEVCLGLMLGLGAYSILLGLRMAGQLIDQQTGWGLISSSAFDDSEVGTVSGELLFWLGTVLLFVLGGHLLLISALLDTFRTFPPGAGELNVEIVPVLSQLVRQSLTLALQLSAPVIATQILAGVMVSYATMMAPQFQQSGTGIILRLGLATLVLVLTLSGLSDRLLDLLPGSIQLWSAEVSCVRHGLTYPAYLLT